MVLARQIADRINRMIAEDTLPEPQKDGTYRHRRMRPGDIMILFRRRSPLFSETIRACKAAGLPMAGADRLKVAAELAVRDIGALLAFLATPEDDLALATALRSPLFGWSEQDLYSIAQPRSGYLWPALRDAGADHPNTLSMVSDLLAICMPSTD